MISVRMTACFAVALGATALAPGGSAAAAHVAHARAVPPARAAGAVVLGSTTYSSTYNTCYSTPPTKLTQVQQTAPPSGPSYTVPADGVLTSFSYRAVGAVHVRAVLLFPAGTNTWVLAAKSETMPAAASQLNTFPTRLPARAGEVLALSSVDANNLSVCAFSSAGATSWAQSVDDVDTATSIATTPVLTGLVDISAMWEPDADHDGYGDLSQDQCPALASTQAPCPVPDTTVTKKPAKRTSSRRVKVKFSSSIAGSAFVCTLDHKAPKACTSPFKTRVKAGKHRLLVQAVTAFGTSDASPATVSWKVLPPRRR